ncbi:YihY/virulence factor BrkB family protein [Truepera radiovictrix]|uniref:Ribonuclease BN n=1 Tax=Truepera radiovictrix (strain DSM 17093 / CIP 108686 / LMG 22925 / RQ-24) TaxID=649638 RepID=D7CU69_TRURR|nr:YihY/virulence factor BrkB family protein [Truepera radiovictrix]ADI13967.1 ribonuclease BN [Truepera radiovictrix DSM 17093]WMT57469.1 YihY/virulence factor BrkB family protein [Truepera radiovictrix]
MDVLRIFSRAAMVWSSHNAPRLGAALAFYTVLSLAPLLFVAVGMTSVFLSQAEVQAGIIAQVSRAVGEENAAIIAVLELLFRNIFDAYARPTTGVLASLGGFAGVLFGASLVLLELRASLNTIWGIQAEVASKREGVLRFLKNRVISVLMVFGLGFSLLVLVVLNTYLSASAALLQGRVPVVMLQRLETTLSLGLIFAFFLFVFKVLPSAKVQWREVWLGALVSTLLFAFGRYLIGAYLANSALSSAYGAAGSFVLVLLFVFYSAQILFFGAALCRAQRERARVYPA